MNKKYIDTEGDDCSISEEQLLDFFMAISKLVKWSSLVLGNYDKAEKILKDDEWAVVVYENLRQIAVDFIFMKEKITDMTHQMLNYISTVNMASSLLYRKYGVDIKEILPTPFIKVEVRPNTLSKDKLN